MEMRGRTRGREERDGCVGGTGWKWVSRVGSVWVRFHGSEGAEAPPGCERMLSDALTI